MNITDRNGNPALSVANKNGEILPISEKNPLFVQLVGGNVSSGGGSENADKNKIASIKLKLKTLESHPDYLVIDPNIAPEIKWNKDVFSLKIENEWDVYPYIYAPKWVYFVKIQVHPRNRDKDIWEYERLPFNDYFPWMNKVGAVFRVETMVFHDNAPRKDYGPNETPLFTYDMCWEDFSEGEVNIIRIA